MPSGACQIAGFSLFLLSIRILWADSSGECPSNWTKYPKTGACYKVNPKRLTWAQAESECISGGGRLAGIADEYENQFVYNVARGANLSTGTVWLGRLGRTGGKMAPFDWNDSTSAHFHSFRSIVESSSSQCVTMWLDLERADGSWQPWECSYNGYASVCKRLQRPPQQANVPSSSPRSHVSTRCCLPSANCHLRCPTLEKCVPDDLNCLTSQCPNATGWCLPKNP